MECPDDLLKSTFESFNKIYTSEILSPTFFQKSGINKKYYSAWKVIREISVPLGAHGRSVDCTFYICFHKDFPYTFPSVYISEESFNLISKDQYIPHVDDNLFVCSLDKEKYSPNQHYPYETLIMVFNNSIEIIEKGIRNQNTEDFHKEFSAYWKLNYRQRNNNMLRGLSLIKKEELQLGQEIGLVIISKLLKGYSFVIHNQSSEYSKFIKYLDSAQIKYIEATAFYITSQNIHTPPFSYKVVNTLKIIEELGEEVKKSFKTFINNGGNTIVFSKSWQQQKTYYGWYYHIRKKIDGFRHNIKPYDSLNTPIGKTDKVQRILFDDLTQERLQLRTAGTIVNPKKFMVSGLGSIGSNLVYFLNNYEVDTFVLNDLPTEGIGIENIKRHLGGFSDVNYKKASVLEVFLLNKNPFQNVITKELSLSKLIMEDVSTINNVDFLFVCIGKSNIEQFVCNAIINKVITIPVFIFWVEPYLASGQVIYINPVDGEKAQKLLNSPFFKYHVISDTEYRNENSKVYLKEGGCHTGYFPFSSNAITLFLSGIYSHMDKIIKQKNQDSQVLTWIGDMDLLKGLEIKISEFGTSQKEINTLIINKL